MKELINTAAEIFPSHMRVVEAVEQMVVLNQSSALVYCPYSKKIKGIVTLNDVLRKAFPLKDQNLTLNDILTPEVHYAYMDHLLESLKTITRYHYSHFPVVRSEKDSIHTQEVVGMIMSSDLAKKHIESA